MFFYLNLLLLAVVFLYLKSEEYMNIKKSFIFTYLDEFKKNPADYRPDICHQSLLALLDSPLNKAGLLQIYLRTKKNVLIEIHPSLRIPRTIKRFNGLMAVDLDF